MKVEVKEAQSNEVLQQGDYVTNLTKEQFEELLDIGKCVALSWKISKGKDNDYISKSLTISAKGRLNHTEISKATTKLPFEEFKQRAINTFKDGSTKENVCVFIEDEAQLEQARELLVKYWGIIFKDLFHLNDGNHLIYDSMDNDWWVASSQSLIDKRTKITLTELEQILKDEK